MANAGNYIQCFVSNRGYNWISDTPDKLHTIEVTIHAFSGYAIVRMDTSTPPRCLSAQPPRTTMCEITSVVCCLSSMHMNPSMYVCMLHVLLNLWSPCNQDQLRGLVQSPCGKINVIMTLGGGLVHDVIQHCIVSRF